MNNRPSIDQLRTRVFKHSGTNLPEIGNFLARRVGRPSAVYGTWLAVRLGLSAHVITLLALVVNMFGAIAIGSGTRWGFVGGVALLWLAYWLDHVDGQVARWRGSSSLEGVYLDYLMHHAATMTLGFALGFGLTMQTGEMAWTLAGFVVAIGWTMLNLHNDCRYKAFFQRLKRDSVIRRVDRASQIGPMAPTGMPTRFSGAIAWLIQKACEPHLVIIGLTAIGCCASVAPTWAFFVWKSGVLSMAIVAPTLAIARIAKSIAQRSIEAEFGAWFRSERNEAPSRRAHTAPRGTETPFRLNTR